VLEKLDDPQRFKQIESENCKLKPYAMIVDSLFIEQNDVKFRMKEI